MNNTNSLLIFDFNGNEIRVVTIDNQSWFVAADVCKVLGLENTAKAVRELNAQQSRTVSRSNVTSGSISFPNRGATCISEGGLNRLILRSDKPEARPFQDWITDVVNPAIRKDGGYIMGEEKVALGEMSKDEFWAKAVMMVERKLSRLKVRKEMCISF